MVTLRKYSYWSKNVFKLCHIMHRWGALSTPWFAFPTKIKQYLRRKELFPIQMETYYLDISISLQGVSLKGQHLGYVCVRAGSWYSSSTSWRESLSTCFLYQRWSFLQSITKYSFIHSINIHGAMTKCALLESVEIESWIRLNLCPQKFSLPEEDEKTNETIVTL